MTVALQLQFLDTTPDVTFALKLQLYDATPDVTVSHDPYSLIFMYSLYCILSRFKSHVDGV